MAEASTGEEAIAKAQEFRPDVAVLDVRMPGVSGIEACRQIIATVDGCRVNVAVEGYSPLKGTRLRDRTLAEIAGKYGATPAQVVLRWHIDIGVIVIPRSARPERIEQNFDLFGFSLTPGLLT